MYGLTVTGFGCWAVYSFPLLPVSAFILWDDFAANVQKDRVAGAIAEEPSPRWARQYASGARVGSQNKRKSSMGRQLGHYRRFKHAGAFTEQNLSP